MPKKFFSKIIFTLVLIALIIPSCSSKKEVVPKGIIEPAKMTEMLVDMQIAESTLMHIQQNGMNANTYKKEFYNLIFEKYQTNKENFEKSFAYYSKSNIQLLDKIYADVITSLSQKQSLIKAQ